VLKVVGEEEEGGVGVAVGAEGAPNKSLG